MKFQLAPELVAKLKGQDVRIRNNFKDVLKVFANDAYNLELDNHELKREWKSFRSIDVTADLRAIYKEDLIDGEPVAYFVSFGTHKELYKKN